MNNMHHINSVASTPVQPQMIRNKGKNKLIIILPIVLSVLLLCAGSVFAYFQFFAKTEVDIVKDFDDTVLELTGYDGEGEIQEIREDVIRQKLAYYDAKIEVQEFIDDIQYTTDKDGDVDLSNGNNVTITAHFNQAYADEHNLKIKNANHGAVEKTIKLTRLREKEEDPETEYSSDYNTSNTQTPDYSTDYNDTYYDERETMDDGAYFKVSEPGLSEDEVNTWDRDKVQLWINYLYAKNGYSFKENKSAKEHFEKMDWYNEREYTGASHKEATANLSPTEKANLKLLTKRRDELKKKGQ